MDTLENKSAESSGLGNEQFEMLKEEMESRGRILREGVEKLLENRQEELLEMIQESTSDSGDNSDLKESLTKEIAQLRQAVVELQEAYESTPTREDLDRVASQSGGGSSSDDLTALAGEFTSLKDRFGDAT